MAVNYGVVTKKNPRDADAPVKYHPSLRKKQTLSLKELAYEVSESTSIGKILSANGYRISLADDGDKVYASARDTQPDLILMDIDMPGLTGIEATKLLKRKRETKRIPIVMMTAIATEDAVLKSQQAGANNYIAKPFSARDLIRRIEETLLAYAHNIH